MTRTRLAAGAALLLLAAPAAAGEGDVQITLGAGALLPGSIHVEPYNWDSGSGLALNAGVDYFVSNRLSAGSSRRSIRFRRNWGSRAGVVFGL